MNMAMQLTFIMRMIMLMDIGISIFIDMQVLMFVVRLPVHLPKAIKSPESDQDKHETDKLLAMCGDKIDRNILFEIDEQNTNYQHPCYVSHGPGKSNEPRS
jgi:hypothetical protein